MIAGGQPTYLERGSPVPRLMTSALRGPDSATVRGAALRIVKHSRQPIQAPLPAVGVLIANRRGGGAFMDDDHVGGCAARLEAHGHSLRDGLRRRTFDRPGVDQFEWRCNAFEHADEPQRVPVWETVADAIAAAWLQIDLCTEAGDTSRSPPLNKPVGLRPGVEESLRRGANS